MESLAFSERYELLVADDQDEIMARQLLSPSLVVWLAEHPLAPGFELRAGMLVVFVGRSLEDEGNLTYLMDATRRIAARVADETRPTPRRGRRPRLPHRLPRDARGPDRRVRRSRGAEGRGPSRPGAGRGRGARAGGARPGMNFADTHQRENSLHRALRAAAGARAARWRAPTRTGAGWSSLLRSGGYAEHAVARADQTFAIPDGLDDGAALALLIQGLTAWHLYRTSAKLADGESVVVVSGRRRSGQPRGPAGEALRRRPGDRHGQLGGEARADARAGRRRRGGPRGGGPDRGDPRGQRGPPGGRGAGDVRRAHVRRRDRGARAVRADRRLRDRGPRAERAEDRPADAQEPRRGRASG